MKEKKDKPVLPKFTIAEMDLFDVPMVGVFKNKEYTAYTLSTLAGIEIDNLDDMEITVEDFMANPEEGKRNMRMDARINIKRGEERANIEIQRIIFFKLSVHNSWIKIIRLSVFYHDTNIIFIHNEETFTEVFHLFICR